MVSINPFNSRFTSSIFSKFAQKASAKLPAKAIAPKPIITAPKATIPIKDTMLKGIPHVLPLTVNQITDIAKKEVGQLIGTGGGYTFDGISSIEKTHFSDSSLGLPKPNEMYSQEIKSGYKVGVWVKHFDEQSGKVIREQKIFHIAGDNGGFTQDPQTGKFVKVNKLNIGDAIWAN